MNRRELIKMIALATGTAFVGSNVLAYTVLPAEDLTDTGFSKDDVAFFNEVGEIILPRTDTPGAKDANVGFIMAIMVADCYDPVQRQAFKDGIDSLKASAKGTYGKDFLQLSPKQRLAVLSTLDQQASEQNSKMALAETQRPDVGLPLPHYFSLIKQLVLFSFFTSEIGATKVLRYVAIPGRYDGEIEYKKGDRAWAT